MTKRSTSGSASDLPHRLRLSRFAGGDPLSGLPESQQRDFLIEYLADLGAESVVEEVSYFDRDYLAEFAAFYSTSSRGYRNVCRRLHFFSTTVNRSTLRRAAEGNPEHQSALQAAYLGFSVIRPIPNSPFGRTVLSWYPDASANRFTPRVTSSRLYSCHLAGIELKVKGLAWQQQDTGVGACATIALWTMLHSSALDEHHAIPTTSEITRLAHRTASLGQRVFPSKGLAVFQLCEAIKETGMAPIVCEGNLRGRAGAGARGFTRERFSSLCASMIRSGYPVLLLGPLGGDYHAVCCVGFRQSPATPPKSDTTELQDRSLDYVYIHDDNLGPNVRFAVRSALDGLVTLEPSAPSTSRRRLSDPTKSYPVFRPTAIVAAFPEAIRISPDRLHAAALEAAWRLRSALNIGRKPSERLGLTLSARFRTIADYAGEELAATLPSGPALGRARLALWEHVAPMSLHVGIARIGWGSVPLVDVLFDTTDTERNLRSFCSVLFDRQLSRLLPQELLVAAY